MQVDQPLTNFIAQLKLQQRSVTVTLQSPQPSPMGSATKVLDAQPQPVFVPEPLEKTSQPTTPPASSTGMGLTHCFALPT